MSFKSAAILMASAVLMSCSPSANAPLDTDTAKAVTPASNTADKPNVLIIMFDDMRFDSFSYRGGPVSTPNIDKLAAQSTRFDTAVTTTGLCSPSRAALFTGRWGHRTGLDDNVELWHSTVTKLKDEEGGLIKRAVDAGYFVGYAGKWHIGYDGPKIRGAQFIRGTADTRVRRERFYTPHADAAMIKGYQDNILQNGEKHQYFETEAGTYEDTAAFEKVQYGQELLRKAATVDKPFFGVVSFNQPHPPYRVPEPYASMYDPKMIKLPANHAAPLESKPLGQGGVYWPWHDVSHMSEMDWRKTRAHYYGAIAMVDRIVGDLLDTAEEVGLLDDLHIVIVGDQGSMLGEHNLYDKGPYAYDELMRMPLIIRDPDVTPKIVNHHVSMMDIAPTLADWMDLKPDGAVDGYSLTSLMEEGDAGSYGGENVGFYNYEWYNGSWFGIRAIRSPELKYVFNASDTIDELYNLKADPGEMTNLIDDPAFADRLLSLRKKLEAELVRTEDPLLERYRYHALKIDNSK